MLRAAWYVARTDVWRLLRRRETLLWTFVMPPVFFFFIGTITAGFAGGGFRDPLALRASGDSGFLADLIETRLGAEGFDVRREAGARPVSAPELPSRSAGAASGSAARAGPPSATRMSADELPEGRELVLPSGFTDSVLAGHRVDVTLRTESEGTEAGYDQVRAARAVYGVLADVAVSAEESEGAPSRAAVERISAAPRTLTLEVAPAGNRRRIPTGFEQAVPGTMVMFTLIVLLTSGAVTLVLERKEGLLRRLAVTPLPRAGIVLGKWMGRMALGLVQIAFAMLAGTLLFHVRWGPDLPMVGVVLAAWAALAAALGLLLGNLAGSDGQATAIGVLAGNVLAALGGCWWPIEVTAPWMQGLARATPTGWTMEALHRLVSFEAGAASALPQVTALVLAAMAAGWAATRTFRFQ